jgi:CLIP-associating protein 1/2
MLAQKRAAIANAKKDLPARPGSAMAHFTPARTDSNTFTLSAGSAKSTTSPIVRSRPESSLAVASGGLSVAPI